MNSTIQRSSSGFCNLTSSITWLFITFLVIYALYSSRIILNRDQPDCSGTASGILTRENLENSLTNSSIEVSSALRKRNYDNAEPAIAKTVMLDDTKLKHIVFGIAASSNLWNIRKEYIRVWWRPGETRGVAWMDKNVSRSRNEGLPEIRISGNTSRFNYTHPLGQRSALRLSRIVSETLRLGMKDVRWFVMGDDDTVFVVDNVVRVLSKYDHTQFYYIGSSSESHIQNIIFSYSMAYGGGGFAISYPLAKALDKMQDRCIQRYPGLYGSDDRMHACMSELGVPLTKEPGFHQYDVYGNLLGLLGAHPVSPLVSMHHIDVVSPIFPHLNRVRSLRHLLEAAKYDSASIIQQSICYDKNRYWSISVSWGYVVQVIRGVISPRELEMPTRTFLNWYRRQDYTGYAFNTRAVKRHPCQKPFVYYMRSTKYDEGRKQIIGVYSLHKELHPTCRWKAESPEQYKTIVVLKRPDANRWQKSPRRDCCRVLPSGKSSNVYIWIGNCRESEISEM